MPFRILKRNSKQYDVVSKSSFVISVELLDNGVMECTLDAESTGRDCLVNISQRLGLHQPEFFGLRYISRGVPPRQRWVELDRPLRKQLEKYSQDSQLSLGLMFYVNDVNLLKDEMARYHYFLQLKSDVIDGKLNCSIDQAISLAAYSLQAEFGDFDPERHTLEYLRDFAILPNLIKEDRRVQDLTSEQKFPQINVDALYEAVVRQYASLIGFPPSLAEIYYIMVAQQLDGYGQEPYPAKDDAGNDILICISANGLIIRRRDWTHIAAFRWIDIKSLLGHKRLFVVESSQSNRTMQYHFSDAEVAKYVRKMCLLQSTFCKENVGPDGSGTQPQQVVTDTISQSQQHQHHIQQHQHMMMNRNINLNNQGGGFGAGSSHYPLGGIVGNHNMEHGDGPYFPGVTPDLLAPAMSSTNAGVPGPSGNSTFFNSASFNQSGLSLNSSSASGVHQNVMNFNPNQNLGGGMYSMPPTSHTFQGFSPLHPLQQHGGGVEQPMMFHHPGELYNQMQMMHTVRTNPLMELGLGDPDPEYSNGYGRAVSEYTAALQQKYGSTIPDLSSRKSSSQLYFSSSSGGGERSRSQSQTLLQIRASLEEEPIYQNEIVSQIHSMELQDSASKSNSASDVNGNASSSSNVNIYASDEHGALTSQMSPSSSSKLLSKKNDSLNEFSLLNDGHANIYDDTSSINYHMHSQPLTTTHPPTQLKDETSPIYVFKPPPPYPGLGSNSNSAGSLVNKSNSGSVQGISTDSSVSNSTTSLSKNSVCPQTPAEVTISQLSPSATSSVVSAQIHCEPDSSHEEDQGEQKLQEFTKNESKEKNDEILTAQDPIVLLCSGSSPSVSLENSTAILETEVSSANSSSISTCVDEINSSKASSSSAGSSESRLHYGKLLENSCIVGHKAVNKAGQLFGKPIDPVVLREFQAIPKTKSNPSFATALKRENSKRNRTPDILPYEDNSVRLSPSRCNPSGYINASPLSVKIGDRSWFYIVAQLPLAGNGPSLWQMIWESDVKVIVSLEKDSSALFYPIQKGASLTFNDFQVVESKEGRRRSSNSLTIAREFNLIYTPKKKQRKVWILPYEEEWKDDGPVHTEHFLCFLEEVNSTQRKVSDPMSSLTVLCGTGAGRSGIFILSDLLFHAADCGHKLRCDALLKELRMQRMSLVSNASQYAFVLHTLAKYLAQSRLI